MTAENLGNHLNALVNAATHALMEQGELAQLTYGAFDIAATKLDSISQDEEIEISFPVGYRPDKTTIQGKRTYRKEELLARYQFLAFHQLAVNGLM